MLAPLQYFDILLPVAIIRRMKTTRYVRSMSRAAAEALTVIFFTSLQDNRTKHRFILHSITQTRLKKYTLSGLDGQFELTKD